MTVLSELRNGPRLVVVQSGVTPLEEWAGWMNAGGMSRRTIEDRVHLVKRLERAAGVSSLTIDWQGVASFLASDRFGPGTRQTYFAHLRAWYRWLVRSGLRVDDPMIMLYPPRAPRRMPRPVTIEQLTRMLATPMRRRTRAMILLGAYEGLRVSEIAAMHSRFIRGGDVRVIGKGGVDADVPLHPLVAEIAETMGPGLWFPSYTRPGPVKGKSVSRTVSDVMRRAGVPGTPHALRHFFGTETLRSSGGNLVVTQELMRHADVSTTAKYTKVDRTARVAAVLGMPAPVAA